MNIKQIAETLGYAKQSHATPNAYFCKCPCCHYELFSIEATTGGSLRVHCPKGCSREDISNALDRQGLLGESHDEGNKKSKKKRPASRDDYIEIIKDFLGDVRRDIFSEDLCYFDKNSKLWVPAANTVAALRSEVRERSINSDKLLKASEIEDSLYHLEHTLAPEFLINVPSWDGRDRIAELAQRVTLRSSPESGIDNTCLEEHLKHWHTKMWLRLVDPTVRNEIFILSGGQNLGKDFWIRENCGGLGQYLINFAIHANERDTKEQLHYGLVMNISEFDRTSKMETSLLKDIVTLPFTNLRFSYARRARPRDCRCSFISSVNIDDIFNDSTGHSRYVFFQVESFDKSTQFSSNDKLQVLAQGLYLAATNYKPSPTSVRLMRAEIDSRTPEAEGGILAARWDYLASEYFKTLTSYTQDECLKRKDVGKAFSGFIPNDLSLGIITALMKEFGKKSPRTIWSALIAAGRQRIDPELGRGYYFKQCDNPAVQESYGY